VSPFPTHSFAPGEDGRCTYTRKDDNVTSGKLVCGQEEKSIWHYPGGLPEQVDRAYAKEQQEAVDHPKHYGGADDPFEHVKVAEAKGWGYHIGNCTKYLWRMGLKVGADDLEDLKKARWYLDRFIKMLEKRRGNGPREDGFNRSLPGGVFAPHHERCMTKQDDHIICRWKI